ncbi:MAG: rhomboid family intramembrane serine protease [Phycisphaerales bacterium]|jgi:membrane associated rhomboid family serine protease|nr:rhomboid family intramembrane serine protease [Phycisphaerales bacterium]
MGLDNRTYCREDQGGGYGGAGGGGGGFGGGMRAGQLPKPSQAITVLLIANVVIFLLQHIRGVSEYLMLFPTRWWFVWNYITFQFAHGDVMHLFGNMLGLYMLGGVLERAWGARRFVIFYLTCGIFAGLCHLGITYVKGGSPLPLLGASGGVFGILAACAILFPHIKLIVFLFLVPIRFMAILLLALGAYYMLLGGGGNTAHAAHLGGAVMGAFWVWGLPRLQGAAGEASLKRKQGAWDRKMKQRAEDQSEIDRILDKIRAQGLNSLSRGEKHTLQQATKRQQADEDKAHRL